MDYKNVQSASRKGMKDIPDETNIDYEKEDEEELELRGEKENSDEKLKKLGRQTEA